ncbi:nucleoside triphosphate pyrophosphohydrolase HAM1 [Ascoidea rubescens DSM 1968]|uniref:Inosine triphosphate pyrophosphatase n=1 Tax=Ascoidea rubescens DSM 1968 TaxID=1344418 RepID=A0A1D2VDV1_9ASCO|nr:putative inosine triphosphate pyrophosphatase [Ascoidea rubescens DSM 1968]ODV59647.1 putative inosine triphosphate pyrophosphatase [Ascoidea rubescens DSM 1968]
MVKEVVFVTGNSNKLKEVVSILSGPSFDSQASVNVVGHYKIVNQSLDLDEVQGTISEVTIKKAQQAANWINKPVLVEDTALVFNAFYGENNGVNDLPGPYIKWFLKNLGLTGLINLLYKFDDKSAKAICTFGYCEGPNQPVLLFQGITEGIIVDKPRGPTDFGWDPIFQPVGFNETYAELDKKVKNSISHRFKALDKVKDFFLNN